MGVYHYHSALNNILQFLNQKPNLTETVLDSDLEVLVPILRTRHPLFPITHVTTTKNHLLNA